MENKDSSISHPVKPSLFYHGTVLVVGEFRHPMRGPGVYWWLLIGEVKHTDTIFYVIRQNRLHPRERVIVLEIEKGLQNNTWRRITQLPVHTLSCIWQQGCCHGQQLLFLSSSLLFTFSHTLTSLTILSALSSFLLLNIASFIGISWSTWRGK